MMDIVDCAILVNEEADLLAESMLDTLQRGGVIISERTNTPIGTDYDPFDVDPNMVVDTYTAYDAPEEYDQIGMDAEDYLDADEDISTGGGYGDIIDTMMGVY